MLTGVHGKNCNFQYLLCAKGGNTKSMFTRATAFVFCTSSHGALQLWEISLKYLKRFFNLQSGHKYMVEMARFNIQRAITPKVCKPQFIRSARPLMEI